MTIEIIKTGEDTFMVNGKSVYKDLNDKWIGQRLTQDEVDAFNKHRLEIEKVSGAEAP